MFLGTYHPRLDDKGRLLLPARFRDSFVEGIVITRGQERCLYGFAQEQFDRMSAGLNTDPGTPRRLRDYSRVFYASATPAQVPDKQGRLTVPQDLRELVGLRPSAECVVAGVNDHIELWDPTVWDDYLARTEAAMQDEED